MADLAQPIPRGLLLDHPIVAVKAGGCYLWDDQGKRYLDFTSGVGALPLGHAHGKVVEAIRSALNCGLLHTCFCNVPTAPSLRLMDRLASLVPVQPPVKVLLCSMGAEAVENAIKVSRAFTGRENILCFSHAFHGRTWMAMTLTANKAVRDGFGPLVDGTWRIPYGESEVLAATDLRDFAAVIVEPIAGEGGVLVPPNRWLANLARRCREDDVLLIADEIQTGLGRTGTLFAVDPEGIQPDILVLSKALGGGLPLSAVIGRADLMDAVPPGGLSGGTFGGNPVACEVSQVILDAVANEDFLARVRVTAGVLLDRLVALTEGRSDVRSVRGRGLMLGIEFESPARAASVIAGCREYGLLLLHAGEHREVVRLLPPLTIGEPEIQEACLALEKALRAH